MQQYGYKMPKMGERPQEGVRKMPTLGNRVNETTDAERLAFKATQLSSVSEIRMFIEEYRLEGFYEEYGILPDDAALDAKLLPRMVKGGWRAVSNVIPEPWCLKVGDCMWRYGDGTFRVLPVMEEAANDLARYIERTL